jgi:hypothetical protein
MSYYIIQQIHLRYNVQKQGVQFAKQGDESKGTADQCHLASYCNPEEIILLDCYAVGIDTPKSHIDICVIIETMYRRNLRRTFVYFIKGNGIVMYVKK